MYIDNNLEKLCKFQEKKVPNKHLRNCAFFVCSRLTLPWHSFVCQRRVLDKQGTRRDAICIARRHGDLRCIGRSGLLGSRSKQGIVTSHQS